MIVGFVGLGSMGLPMAGNLVRAGYRVQGYDLRAERRDALAGVGGVPSLDAPGAARGADVLVLMVVTIAQASAVLLEAGALGDLAPGGVVILTATCPPGEVAALAREVAAAGRTVVDAPVSGGTAGAQAGSLSIMVACEVAVFERVRPVLDAVGGRLFHVGREPGHGAMVKVINQLLCGVHIAVAAEALSLAACMGIDQQAVLDIMRGSAASSWMLGDRGPRMLEAAPGVTSAVDIFVKDLGLVLQAGRDSKAALPLAAGALQLFLAASGRGEGAADDSQVIRSYRLLNGEPRSA